MKNHTMEMFAEWHFVDFIKPQSVATNFTTNNNSKFLRFEWERERESQIKKTGWERERKDAEYWEIEMI